MESSSRKLIKSTLSVSRFVNEHKNKKCSCNFCLKNFGNVSEFFRHVTHAKSCSNHYGEVYIKAMRKELRGNSKRKWYNANKDNVSFENKKKYYVPQSERHTEEGRAFETVFRIIFEEFRTVARDRIQDFSKERANFIDDEDVEKALDKAFDFMEFQLLGNGYDYMEETENEEDNLNTYFKAIEEWFNVHKDSNAADRTYHWKKLQEYKIGNELWTYSSNRAFLTIFDEKQFKKILENSQDSALDEVFFKLIPTENYFKDDLNDSELELRMSLVYSELLEKELLKSSRENGITAKIETLMEGIMKKRVYCDELESV